jgi:MFS family permease
LWSGQTFSVFGSMIGGTAMSFTAILFLQATPFQLGIVHTMQIIPAVLTGLLVGAWVDRLPRRRMMIAVDLGRAVVLLSVPLAALLGVLRIEQIYIVALLVSILTLFFDVAYQSYLPGLVGKEEVLEGNSKLSASAAVAEFGGFSIAGWLVQLFTAPLAILIDAFSFVISALTLSAIRKPETAIVPEEHPELRREIGEGLKTVFHHPLLRSSALSVLLREVGGGMYGAVVVLYMSRGLGFDPGVLGMIWAVGGFSSFLGALLVRQISGRIGAGLAMVFGLAGYAVSMLLIPLASGATLLSALLLIAQQLGDGFFVVYDVNLVSMRQEIVAERLLGRVNATLQFLALCGALAGGLLGGILGELIGVRSVLAIGGGATLCTAIWIGFSPLGRYRSKES